MVNPQPQMRRRAVPGYQLDTDIDKGYKDSVEGNQTNMALRYLQLILERQQKELSRLYDEVELLKTAPKAQTKPKPDNAAKTADPTP